DRTRRARKTLTLKPRGATRNGIDARRLCVFSLASCCLACAAGREFNADEDDKMLSVPTSRSVRRVCALLLCVPLCVGLVASRSARAQQPRTNVRDGQRYP